MSPALEVWVLTSGPPRESLFSFNLDKGFPSGSVVDNLSAMQETQFRTLDQEDPLEKKMATHSSNLAWRIPWTEESAGLRSIRSQRVRHD